MAHINLLPWREKQRQERQQQFFATLGAGAVFAIIVLFLVVSYANSLIEEQNSRNVFLQQEISKLDRKIREIKDLESERDKLIARMQVIQELQESRPKVVKVFDAIARTVPDGISMNKLTRTGNVLKFDGVAESNARVSVFMRKLDNDNEFGESTLEVVQRKASEQNASRNFTVKVNEVAPKADEGDQ